MRFSWIIAFLVVLFLCLAQNFFLMLGLPFTPPLVVIAVVYFSLTTGVAFGMVLAVFAGILIEPFVLGRIGGESLTLAITAYICGRISGPFFKDSLFSKILLPGAAYIFYTVLRMGWHRYLGGYEVSVVRLPSTLFMETVSVLLFSPMIFYFLSRVSGSRRVHTGRI